MGPLDTANALKLLDIRFESSTMVLTNVTTFGEAVGTTALVVDTEVEFDTDDKNISNEL
jgi:hypothetical protein